MDALTRALTPSLFANPLLRPALARTRPPSPRFGSLPQLTPPARHFFPPRSIPWVQENLLRRAPASLVLVSSNFAFQPCCQTAGSRSFGLPSSWIRVFSLLQPLTLVQGGISFQILHRPFFSSVHSLPVQSRCCFVGLKTW